MKRLYFGGSFDPIHHGHLLCARSVAEAADFDQVILVPAGQPPHKSPRSDLAAAEHRLAMCRAAVAGDALFRVDPIETLRLGPSFTIDTVGKLKANGETSIHWLIGADMAAFLPQWRQAVTLLREVHFVLMARPGWSFDFAKLPTEFRHLQSAIVDAPLIDISSTDIRQRVRNGLPIAYLTPPVVVDYIQSHQLYRESVTA